MTRKHSVPIRNEKTASQCPKMQHRPHDTKTQLMPIRKALVRETNMALNTNTMGSRRCRRRRRTAQQVHGQSHSPFARLVRALRGFGVYALWFSQNHSGLGSPLGLQTGGSRCGVRRGKERRKRRGRPLTGKDPRATDVRRKTSGWRSGDPPRGGGPRDGVRRQRDGVQTRAEVCEACEACATGCGGFQAGSVRRAGRKIVLHRPQRSGSD